MTSPPIEEVLAQLAGRVLALEDELAITRLLTSYGLAVDGDDADGCADLYAPAADFWLDGRLALSGRAELKTIVSGDAHQAILPGCAHVMGPFAIEIAGDDATATGYATVYVAESGGRQIWRQSIGRWTLARVDGRWRVTRRESWATGLPDGQEAARSALHRQLAAG